MAEDQSVDAIQKAIEEANDKLLKSQEAVRKSQEDLVKAQERANDSDESQELLRSLSESTAELVESNRRLEEQTPRILGQLTENLEEAEGKKADQFASLVGTMRELNPKRWNAEMLKEKHKDLVNDKEKLDNQKTLIEEYGGVATANKKYRDAERQYRLDEFELQKQSATTRAGRKEIRGEEREYKKKHGTVMQKIAANTSGMLGNMKDKMKTAGKGVLAFLSTLALGAALILLGKFLQSKTWEDISARLNKIDWAAFGTMLVDIIEGLGNMFGSLWTYFMGGTTKDGKNDGQGFFSRFGKTFDKFKKDGIIAGLTEMMGNFSILEMGIVGILGVLAPLAFIFKRIKGIVKLVAKIPGVKTMLAAAGLSFFAKPAAAAAAPTVAAAGQAAVRGGGAALAGTAVAGTAAAYRARILANASAANPANRLPGGPAAPSGGPPGQGRPAGRLSSIAGSIKDKLTHLKKYPKLLSIAKKIPILGTLLTGAMAISLLTSDKSHKEKVKGIGGLIGGSLGVGGMAALFALLGTAGFPLVGTGIGGLAGALLGWFGGEWAGTKLAEILMGSGSPKLPETSFFGDEGMADPTKIKKATPWKLKKSNLVVTGSSGFDMMGPLDIPTPKKRSPTKPLVIPKGQSILSGHMDVPPIANIEQNNKSSQVGQQSLGFLSRMTGLLAMIASNPAGSAGTDIRQTNVNHMQTIWEPGVSMTHGKKVGGYNVRNLSMAGG